jgi:hypothetical protein
MICDNGGNVPEYPYFTIFAIDCSEPLSGEPV